MMTCKFIEKVLVQYLSDVLFLFQPICIMPHWIATAFEKHQHPKKTWKKPPRCVVVNQWGSWKVRRCPGQRWACENKQCFTSLKLLQLKKKMENVDRPKDSMISIGEVGISKSWFKQNRHQKWDTWMTLPWACFRFFSFPLGEHPCLCNQETGSKAAKGMVQMSWCFSVAGDDTLWLEALTLPRRKKSSENIFSKYEDL